MANVRKIGRSSATGKYVSIDYAKKHPKTTIIETIKVSPIKRCK